MSAARPGRPPGEVVEWLMAPVLKTGEVKASVGSNPTLSVPDSVWIPSPDGRIRIHVAAGPSLQRSQESLQVYLTTSGSAERSACTESQQPLRHWARQDRP